MGGRQKDIHRTRNVRKMVTDTILQDNVIYTLYRSQETARL